MTSLIARRMCGSLSTLVRATASSKAEPSAAAVADAGAELLGRLMGNVLISAIVCPAFYLCC